MPIITGIKLTPPIKSGMPKVKRGAPLIISRPTVESSKPIIKERNALTLEPIEIKIEQLSPSSASQKYSKELNWSATSANEGETKTSISVPNRPPNTEQIKFIPSVSRARPLCANRCESLT